MTVPPLTVRRAGVTAMVAVCAFALLAACSPSAKVGKDSEGATILHWYVGPERVDTKALAASCSLSSGGDYEITVEQLPADIDKRRNVLVRRLAAKDRSIDLIGLDDSFTAEFAEAQLLAPVPDDLAPVYSKDIFPKALEAASYEGALVAAPWWFDPQLLWYRGAVAERAGLDVTKAISWESLIDGAQRIGVSIDIDDSRGHGVPRWIAALVSSAGGAVVDGTGRGAKVGLGGAAGREAASVIQYYAETSVGPGPSAAALDRFAGTEGGFLLASSSVISDPALANVAADMKWAPYPVTDSASPSVAPLAGVNLAVPLYAPHSELSYRAISCLTETPAMEALMTSAGHSSARSTTYDLATVASSYPMADVTKQAVANGATVPQTPYWPLIRSGLVDTWLPLTSVDSSTTPAESQKTVKALLAGSLP